MKRVVVSDVHIGSKYYNGDELIEFLQSEEYDQLILAGDIIDFIKVPTFSKRAIDIVNSIDFSKEVIYIVGNHDTPLSGFVGHEAFGIKFLSKYEFEDGGRKFRVEHGDTYDELSIIQNNFVMAFLSVSQHLIESWLDIDMSTWYTDWKVKRRKLRRIWDILKRNKDVDVFIMGHSHTPECVIWINEEGQIKTFVNSGDWLSHTSFVRIEDGVVRLKSWKK